MTHDPKSPAEQIADLLRQLDTEVRTEESVLRYRTVKRGKGRTEAVPDFVMHRTRLPGLMAQARAAAVPSGSPGWDADGALSPMSSSGSFESAEPVTEAFYLAEEYAATMADIAEFVAAAGHRTPVEAALADQRVGWRVVGRLRSLVAHCRVVLGYDAPIMSFRDVYCPECGGELRFRKDASSAVWCSGKIAASGPALPGESWPLTNRCDASWPRGSWVKLLEEATKEGKMAG